MTTGIAAMETATNRSHATRARRLIAAIAMVLTFIAVTARPAAAHDTSYPNHGGIQYGCVRNPNGPGWLIGAGGLGTRIWTFYSPLKPQQFSGYELPDRQQVYMYLEVYGRGVGNWMWSADGFQNNMNFYVHDPKTNTWSSIWSGGVPVFNTFRPGAEPYSTFVVGSPGRYYVTSHIYWDFKRNPTTGAINWSAVGNVWHQEPLTTVVCG